MRLFLLPITRSRTLLYCQRLDALHQAAGEKQGIVDRVTARAARTWADWERRESGWQRTVVRYGNAAFRRIPYQEWGLKSVPPLSAKRRRQELAAAEGERNRVELVFPESVIPKSEAEGVLQRLGSERDALHRQRLIWCIVGMPITAPIAIIPVIPNIPFFYLVYRAWSHWRALAGGTHIRFLLENKLVSPSPSALLDQLYGRRVGVTKLAASKPAGEEKADPAEAEGAREPDGGKTGAEVPQEETILIDAASAKELAKAMDVPDLETELERAVWQVETALKKEREAAKQQQGDSARSVGSTEKEEDKKQK